MAGRRRPKEKLETQTVDDEAEKDSPIAPQRELEPGKENATKSKQPRKKKIPTTRGRNAAMASNPSIEEFVKWTKSEGLAGIRQLFTNNLAMVQPPSVPAPSFEANEEKNRFRDVVCLEETRVKLEKDNPTDGDYIHANYVKFPGYDRQYICTQGPLENTAEDFWRMVWQEKAPVIVNLTTCCNQQKAENKGQCYQYWPLDQHGPMQCGRFNILTKSFETEPKLDVYVLELLPEGCSNSHIVRLIHTTAWQDKGVMNTRMLLKLIKKIYWADKLAKDTIIIHCGAGIGRTGALVLIDYTLYRLVHLKISHNLEESFRLLRRQRASSIQQEFQFVFVVVTILRYMALAIKTPAVTAAADEFYDKFKVYKVEMEEKIRKDQEEKALQQRKELQLQRAKEKEKENETKGSNKPV